MQTFKDFIDESLKNGEDSVIYQWINDVDNSLIKKTYGDYFIDMKKFANYVLSNYDNISKKHFAIVSKNSYEYVVAIFGIIYAGGVVVPISNQCDDEELKYEIEFSDSNVVFADNESKARIESISSDINVKSINGYEEYDSIEMESSASLDDLVALIFTSGTSGTSKCVMINLRNVISCEEGYRQCDVLDTANFNVDTISCLLFLPLNHVLTFGTFITSVYYGVRMDICLNIKNFVRDMVVMRTEKIVAVPMIMEMFYNDVINNRTDNLKYVKTLISGGAPVNSSIIDAFSSLGILVTQGYGLSEVCGPLTYNQFPYSKKYNSIGKNITNLNEMKIIDNEICVKGDSIMTGYYKNEKETNEVLIDGWLHTGDLGMIDDEGYYYITGRKKNLIILSSGENISPEELESKIKACPLVKEVIVKVMNNALCSIIYCDKKDQDQVKEHINLVNKSNPLYKRIANIEFVDKQFDTTSSGKIKRQ